jgi:hypothetical protein
MKPSRTVTFVVTDKDTLKDKEYETHFVYDGQVYQCPGCQHELIATTSFAKNVTEVIFEKDFHFKEEDLQ